MQSYWRPAASTTICRPPGWPDMCMALLSTPVLSRAFMHMSSLEGPLGFL